MKNKSLTLPEIEREIEKLQAMKIRVIEASNIPFTKKESGRWEALTNAIESACEITIPIKVAVLVDTDGDIVDIFSDGWEEVNSYKMTQKDMKPIKDAQKSRQRFAVELAKKYKTTVEEVEAQME